MTLEEDELDQELVHELKRSAEGVAAPPEVRNRVRVRLAGAGVVGLASSVAGAAGAGGAPASALSLVGLTKTLLIGVALGTGAGVGLHVAFNGVPRLATEVHGAAPSVAAVSRERDAGATRSQAPSVNTPPARSAPSDGPARSVSQAAKVPTAVNPAPELPVVAPPPVASGAGLAEQQTLLDDGRAALRRGDGKAALAAIGRHVQRFPRTAFEEEREAVVIRALVLTGALGEAHARVGRFAQRFPRSLLLPSLDAALSGAGAGRDSVMDAAGSAQSPSNP